jgi:coenzyme F420-0:L-glutamate ligase/coenzyme F420-1:gamma-L-glutamate ligase
VTVELLPISGIGEVEAGADLAQLIIDGLHTSDLELTDGDIVVVTHKVVSKAEGAMVEIGDDEATYRELVESEAVSVLRRRGDLIIAETRHGFVCANGGVDRSNVPLGWAALLPRDPDASAHGLRTRLEREAGASCAVIISDTFGRAWRRGIVDVAIGISGMPAMVDLRGTRDAQGRTLQVTEVAVADEVAAAAELAMGKACGIPVVVVRGVSYEPAPGRGAELVRDPGEDFFR